KAQNCSQDKQPLQMLMKYFRTFNPKNKTLIPAKNSESSISRGKHQCKQSF
ncbi:unnamed protein product, partial [Prunus brigantina]